MLQWRIYYIDRKVKTFDSSMGSPFEAPSYGVGLIVQANEDAGRQVVMRHDRYYFRTDDTHETHPDGAWWGSDREDMWDQLYNFMDVISAVKQGRNCSDLDWRALVELAIKDPDFPVLSRRFDHTSASKSPTGARGRWPGFGDKISEG